MRDHIIICGFGRVGRSVTTEFALIGAGSAHQVERLGAMFAPREPPSG